jgi:hypothetical protein
LVGTQARISRVFSVPGKTSLFSKVKEHAENRNTENAFFIVDADFDVILERPIPESDRLHVLEEYCIENFVLEEEAAISIMQEESPKIRREDLKRRFDFNKWLQSVVEELTPLFACFIFIQKHQLPNKNVDIGIGSFISGREPRLDKKRVQEYIANLSHSLPTGFENRYSQEIPEIISKMGDTWVMQKKYICGKHYLIRLLFFEIVRNTRSSVPLDSLRFRLMRKCTFDSLTDLKNHILNFAPRR